jgi:uncharacterized protein YdaU (DUF1376 family)
MPNKSPAFQFYPQDWLADINVQMMTAEEESAYIRLICYCWLQGAIPADEQKLALLIKGGSTTVAATVSAYFEPHPTNKDLLIHPRLEYEREKQRDWSDKSSFAGKKSHTARLARREKKAQNPQKLNKLNGGCNLVATKPQPNLNQTSDVGCNLVATKPQPNLNQTSDVGCNLVATKPQPNLNSSSSSSSSSSNKNKDSCAEVNSAPTIPTPKVAGSLPLIDGTDYEITIPDMEQWQEFYPAIDVKQQLMSMKSWLLANPKNKKTRSGITRFIDRWLRDEQNRAPRVNGGMNGLAGNRSQQRTDGNIAAARAAMEEFANEAADGAGRVASGVGEQRDVSGVCGEIMETPG